MAGAMACVRAELGAEALILATRRTREGVEITAALEPDPPAPPMERTFVPASPASPAPDPPGLAALRFHGVPALLRDSLLRDGRLTDGRLTDARLTDARLTDDWAAALAGQLRFAALELMGDAPPLLLIGPPGAGKTLTIARLATRLVLGGVRPMVITADGRRAGAMEQLCAFTRLLDINLIAASHPIALARALAARPAGAPVLIDTTGIDPFDPAQCDEIAQLLAATAGTAALVLPAGLDPGESADIAAACVALGARHLVGTRFDLARRLGGIVAAGATGLALAEAGIGPGAADGLASLTPAFLAARLRHIPAAQPDIST